MRGDYIRGAKLYAGDLTTLILTFNCGISVISQQNSTALPGFSLQSEETHIISVSDTEENYMQKGLYIKINSLYYRILNKKNTSITASRRINLWNVKLEENV